MGPTTLLLVASFLAPVPSTEQKVFSEDYSEYSALHAAPATFHTVGEAHALLATEFLAIDPPSSRRSLIEEEITTYAQIPDDWDGEGGSAPSIETIISATLIAKYVPQELKTKTMVSSSGAISLYWDESGGYAELGVDPSQLCYFFARDRNGKETYIDNLSVADVASREWLSCQLEVIHKFAT